MIATVLAMVVTLAPAGAATPEHVPLVMTVTNTGKSAQRFCVYHTPFEGVRNAFMDVTDASGKTIEYAGMMAKRSPPTSADYRTLAPGQSLKASFDLHEGYSLAKGRYTLRFSGSPISGLPASAPITLDVR